ncbi:CdiA family toxin C-terminal domain-containing protein [Listeria welshimeri]|uniref:CdiA family toxin C-terminal domain-containing protein n=1 Tax=Listeria welshimeri TaxID=1643 RepID=UPI001E5714A4|nr:CdiA family toxin C-terminal domain-containing protein [Listeria welshimeri]
MSTGERYTRAGFGVLDVIPGVKAFTTGAKAVGTGSKLLRLGDNVLADSKNIGRLAKGTMGEGLQAGKQAMHLRLSNAQKIAQQAGANVQRKLAKDWNDLGAAAKAIQGKAKQAIPLAPRERLALAGGGSIPEQSAAGASAAATKKKLQEMMQKMDNLNMKGSGESGIIKKASGANDFKFGSNSKNHLKNVEAVNTKKGVVGGHNMDEFNNALKNQGFNPEDLIVSKKPHPTIDGVYGVEYKIPRKDMAGNIAEPVSYKNIKQPKTIYDPVKISDEQLYRWGQEAMKNGKIDGRLVEGKASNGLKFRGYLNEAGEITNFFPILD